MLLRLALLLQAAVLAAAIGTPGTQPRSDAAVQGRMSFQSFGPDQGMGTATTWDMLQDRDGFMWVGAEDGLYRFDGSRFKTYGLKQGLPSHFIWCLHQDAAGTLWVGTFQGLARLRQDRFETVPVGPGGGTPEVWAIGTGPQGHLWITTPEGPYRQGPDGHWNAVAGWPGGAATALWARPDGAKVWVAAWAQSQARILCWENGAWTQVGSAGEQAVRIDALAVDGEQRVWARSLKALWRLNPGDGLFHPTVPALPPGRQRGQLYVDRKGRVWATTEQGLAVFAKDGLRWITQEAGLPDVSLTTVREDLQGTLWVAGFGVYHMQGGGAWRSYPPASGLPAGPVWSVFKDRDGQRFAGTDRGLYRQEPEGWRLVKGSEGIQVRTIVQAPDKTYYLAGSPEILRWEPGKNSFTRFTAADGVVTGGRIFRLLLGPDGTLWVATDRGGLLRGSPQAGRMSFQRVDVPLGLPQESFKDICLDAGGRIWASGDHGLLVLDAGQWRRFTTRDGLREDHVTYLHPTADGQVTFAYFEPLGLGVATCNGGFRLLKHLDATLPPDKIVYLMGQDYRGNFWVGTGQGLYRVNPAHQVEHFGRGDGLVGDDINSMAFLAEPDGDVWIGTSFGLAHYFAARDLGVPKPPHSAVLACRLGGNPAQVNGPGKLTVSSRTNTFEADFACLSFVKVGDVRFQTRMVGLEPEWRTTQSDSVRYSALAPGRYRFEVRSSIGLGEWGPVATVAFEVLPTWWQSVWFRILAGLSALGLIGLGAWAREAALHRRNRLLEQMVGERTQALALANEQLKNQNLTDPLTGLRNRRFLGVCMPDDIAQVNRIHRSSLRQGSERLAKNIDMIFIMVDLDHFKDVNDHYGHAAGDLVLQEMAQILRAATRDSDTIVRWGGEEFLVLARNSCRDDATVMMDRITSQVAQHAFRLEDGRVIHCTCSVGFTFYPFLHEHPELLTWERLLDLSDHCLYAAKRGGRNAWVGLFPTATVDATRLTDRIPAGIGELIRKQELEVKTSLAAEVILEWDGTA